MIFWYLVSCVSTIEAKLICGSKIMTLNKTMTLNYNQ